MRATNENPSTNLQPFSVPVRIGILLMYKGARTFSECRYALGEFSAQLLVCC